MRRFGPVGGDALACIAPYAAWMALMYLLPSEPWAYALRTMVTAAVLVWAIGRMPAGTLRVSPRGALWGVAAGLAVLALWVLPEQCAWYRRWCTFGASANASVAASGALVKAVRLVGSAFVISVAEELFFRRWLLGYAGFAWMVALFALEHDRWLAGAAAGAVYGVLALRRGLGAAAVAHAVTNLALGAYVLATGDWAFW